MATLAKLVVKLVTDITDFSGGLDQAAKKWQSIGGQMTAIGDKMTLGVTAPLVAAGTAAVKFASDLEETRNKTRVVFGEMAEQVLAMGNTAADSMGMSENAALSYAATYGSILKNMGLTEDQVAEMSTALTQLTADYASFHNLKPEEAFEKIKAGLVGSSEPLLSLGKDLRVAAVQAYAMQNGIGAAGGELTNQELALARYGALLAQSNDEMGDFARTSDGLANSTRTFRAQLEDTFASFGEILIPTVTDFLQALIPMLKFFNDLPQPVKQAIIYFGMFLAAIGPILSVGGRLLSLGGGILKLFGAKGALAAAGPAIASGFSGAAAAAGGFIATIGAAALPVIALIAAITALGFALVKFGPQAWETVKMLAAISAALLKQALLAVGQLGESILDLLGNIVSGIGRWVRTFWDAGKALITGFVQGAQSVAWQLVETVLRPIRYIIDQVRKLLKLGSPSRVFAEIGQNMMLGLAEGIEQAAARPLRATVTAVNGTVPAVTAAEGMGAGGRREVHIGEIRIYGDLSDGAKRALRTEMRGIAEQVFGEAVE